MTNLLSPAPSRRKKVAKKKRIPPAVTEAERLHLERMQRELERIERQNDELRRRMRG